MHPTVGRGGVSLESCPALPAVFEVIDEIVSVFTGTYDDGTAFGRIGRCSDVIAVDGEVGDQCGGFGYSEAVSGVGAD